MRAPPMIAWLSASAVARMLDEARARYPRETGGVLVGHWAADGSSLYIAEASGPGPDATHATTCFVPDDDFQREYVAREYRESGRIRTYLGDWHTHPNGDAALSGTDIATLERIARTRAARAPSPSMLVLAGSPSRWTVTAWVLRRPRSLWRRRDLIVARVQRC